MARSEAMIGDGTAVGLAAIHAQSAQFQRKLTSAMAIIGQALKRARRPYVAFSGGKDSLVVMGLVEQLRDGVDAHWSDDELEFPESVAYMTAAQQASPQLQVTLGWAEHAGWFRPWTHEPSWRDPLPGALRIEMDADDWWASCGYDLTFTGLRAGENARRQGWLVKAGPIYHVNSGTGLRCCPIWDWTEDDVWAAIGAFGWPYNPAYDTYERIGLPRRQQRVGPLPLTPRRYLAAGWPDLLDRLEARYNRRWGE